ncbi:GDSL-type esterase/lipase family protein [Ureibacillus sinduriensis]|uniref:GDSL-type esterase/lipase family protein n=1 Tax=Ureibacillus sinduriensis TaxID=561440 RepID=UPI000690A99D|nr:GDSL-type esterase/lipase family protein [Ureibacillus sinduriensis]
MLKRIMIPIICCSILLVGCQKIMIESWQESAGSKREITEATHIAEPAQNNNEIAIHPVDGLEEPLVSTALQEKVQVPSTNEAQPDPANDIRLDTTKYYYLALGDSLTKGVGDEELKSGYTKRLVEKLEQWPEEKEVVLDNRGKRGRRSDQLLGLLKRGHYDDEIKNAELITITIGGNDIMKVVKKDLFELKRQYFEEELADFEDRYDQILKEIRLKNPHVPIVVIGLYNPFSVITDEITEFESIITEWNESIETTSKQYDNACFVDIQDLFDENANLVYHTDFFHPNGYGYTIMTERIMSMIKSCQVDKMSQG